MLVWFTHTYTKPACASVTMETAGTIVASYFASKASSVSYWHDTTDAAATRSFPSHVQFISPVATITVFWLVYHALCEPRLSLKYKTIHLQVWQYNLALFLFKFLLDNFGFFKFYLFHLFLSLAKFCFLSLFS